VAPGEAKGAPDHPHRGFETVTYLLDGAMEHKDSAGHAGRLGPGDVQWMTAGGGVVHSELPAADFLARGGRMHGFQLWVNLPRRDKITYARTADGRTLIRLIAGELGGQRGPGSTHTPIVYAHATIESGGKAALAWPAEYNALVYVLRGEVRVGDDARQIGAQQLAVLTREGDTLAIMAEEDADVLLLGGRPLRSSRARRRSACGCCRALVARRAPRR